MQNFITRNQARKAYGISYKRLKTAIESGQIAVRYTGIKTAKVCSADVERVLLTPPNATPV